MELINPIALINQAKKITYPSWRKIVYGYSKVYSIYRGINLRIAIRTETNQFGNSFPFYNQLLDMGYGNWKLTRALSLCSLNHQSTNN